MKWHLDIRVQREFLIYAEPEALQEPLAFALRSRGFEGPNRPDDDADCDDDGNDDGEVFTRGSRLAALYTFDIRKIPTRLVARLGGRAPTHIELTLHAESSLSVESGSDLGKLRRELAAVELELRRHASSEPLPERRLGSTCPNHPDRDATFVCRICGDFGCVIDEARPAVCVDCRIRELELETLS